MKKIIVYLMAGLLVLTSCGRRGELLKVNNIIATKEEKAQTDTAKRYWHALTDFASEYGCAIGCIVVVIVVGSVVAWNWGKWFGNGNFIDRDATTQIRYLSYPDDELRMIIDTKVIGAPFHLYSEDYRQAANDELVRRSGIPLKIPDGVNVALLLDYSGLTTEYLLNSFKGYDNSLKDIVRFIFNCRGECIPEK